jgi:hypothetical protein
MWKGEDDNDDLQKHDVLIICIAMLLLANLFFISFRFLL